MNDLPIIFLAFANNKESASGYLRNLTVEKRKIVAALKMATDSPHPICKVVFETDVTIDKIFEIFQDEKYRDRIAIFHYGGHADDFRLILENNTGEKAPAYAKGILRLLASRNNNLKLVFLNGCTTQRQARELINYGVPSVIGTSRSIPDKLASLIADAFYRGLGAGLSIERAWQDAKYRLEAEEDEEVRGLNRKWDEKHNDLPWNIYYRNNAKTIKEWNLPDAAGDPLFGPSEIDKKYYLDLPDSPYLCIFFPRWQIYSHWESGFYGQIVET